MIASVIANVNRDPKARREPYEPKDFLLRFQEAPEPEADEPSPPADDNERLDSLLAWAQAMGAMVVVKE